MPTRPAMSMRSANQVEVAAAGSGGSSVDVKGINRNLNSVLQGQLWTETSGGAYADTKSQLYQQLQQTYGTPGTASAFDTTFNNFTSAVQALTTSPASYSAQSGVTSAAQQLTQSLNSMTGSIQSLRSQAEQGIANDVQQANQAMQQIAQLNQQLAGAGSTTPDAATATLEDQRDQAITQLSQLMGITVTQNSNNQVSISTSTGLQLVGTQAAQLSFDDRGSLSATSLWSANPAQDSAGTITLTAADGSTKDLIANQSIQSGQIGAYLEMRDQILPQAQSQLDELAAQMSQSLSDQTTSGAPVTSGSQSGFNVGIAGVLPGNSVQVTYTDGANVQHTVQIVRVDDPAALPLPSSAASNPNDQVIGVNFTGRHGIGSGAAQRRARIEPAILQSLIRRAAGAQFAGSSAPPSTPSRRPRPRPRSSAGSTQLPLFTDGATPISGAITAAGSQDVGLAGRITVNSAVLANPGALVAYQTSPPTAAGDPTRPNFLLNQLTKAALTFSPTTGIGSASAPLQRDALGFHEPSHQPAEPGRERRHQSCSKARTSSSMRCSSASTAIRASISIPKCRI